MKNQYILRIKWGTSKARDSYGYTICTLYVDDKRTASCNGGGYDMRGTVLGKFIATEFNDKLLTIPMQRTTRHGDKETGFYGLTFHDPTYDPGKAIIEKPCELMGGNAGDTVEQREKAGESIGLERYQAFYKASSPIPTEKHKVALIDGACGEDAVRKIITAMGYDLERISDKKSEDIYILSVAKVNA